MLETINFIFGIITIITALILFVKSFWQKSEKYYAITKESLRLVSALQLLGGGITIAGTQTHAIIPSYVYTIVGFLLIITSWLLFLGLRTPLPKRKQKPKN